MGIPRHVVACAGALAFACACGTGDTKIDPADLELRDLLGVSPDVATRWDADQRTSARHVFVSSLDGKGAVQSIELFAAPTPEEQLVRSIAALDATRFAAGDDALALVRIEQATPRAIETAAPTVIAVTEGGLAPHVDLTLADRWGALTPASEKVLAALATDAGYRTGNVLVTLEPQLAVIAAYSEGTPARLVVNPVLLAALDPDAIVTAAPAARTPPATTNTPPAPQPTSVAGGAGNPYSFYGSVAECAYAQRQRCETCLPSSSCQAVTTEDGNVECQKLAESDGRGYFLLCINLALAITSVDQCTADGAPSCPQVTDAASKLSQLEANAMFLDDSTCASGLDTCLAKIYGPPSNPYPGLVDGGVGPPPPDPPRSPDVSCGDSCSNNNANCEASPSCDCSGPSCNNSLSCDSTCASSNDQSGCASCDSCSSDGGGASTGGGGCGGGCSGDSKTSSGSSSGCGGGGGGGGCSSSSDSGSGGCGGSSGGGSCGGGSSGGSCGGGGGGSSNGCQIASREPSAGFAVALSLGWAFLPVPVAAAIRRRSRKRTPAKNKEVSP